MTNETTGARADAVELLTSHHRDVEKLWKQAQVAHTNAEHELAQDLVDRLITLLSQHDAIETQALYPTLRGVGDDGDHLADHSLEEHQKVREMLSEVDGKDHREPEVWLTLSRCMDAVAQHVEEEERQVFPALRRVGQDQLDDLGEVMEAAMPLVPTHPHPSTPNNGLAANVVGPIMGAVDKVRDALRKAS